MWNFTVYLPYFYRAWQIALEEARTMNRTGDISAPPGVVVPPGSQVIYPQTFSQGYYPGQVIAAPGQYGKLYN